jgi:hypothetical protein
MADISITAANVVNVSASTESGTSGTSVAAGTVVYKDPVTKKYLLADSDGLPAARIPAGLALNGAFINQPVFIAKSGPIVVGGTLVPGTAYYLSNTPGGICPFADVGTGENSVLLGIATSTTVLDIDIQVSGVTL